MWQNTKRSEYFSVVSIYYYVNESRFSQTFLKNVLDGASDFMKSLVVINTYNIVVRFVIVDKKLLQARYNTW